jgi:hypothetical protein
VFRSDPVLIFPLSAGLSVRALTFLRSRVRFSQSILRCAFWSSLCLVTPSQSGQQLHVFPLQGHAAGQQLSGSARVCWCPGALLLLGLVLIKLFLWYLQIERLTLISSLVWLHPRVLVGPRQERHSCRDSSAPGAPFLLLIFFAAACLRWKCQFPESIFPISCSGHRLCSGLDPTHSSPWSSPPLSVADGGFSLTFPYGG